MPVRANFVVWCYVIDDGPPKIEPTLNRMFVHHIFLPLHFELERDTLGDDDANATVGVSKHTAHKTNFVAQLCCVERLRVHAPPRCGGLQAEGHKVLRMPRTRSVQIAAELGASWTPFRGRS